MMRRWIIPTRSWVLLAALLLGACSTSNPYEPSPALPFTTQSPDAIVIMGVRSAVSHDSFLGMEAYREVEITWTSVPVRGSNVRQTTFTVGTKDIPWGLPGGGLPDEMRWRVLRIPPGTYTISKIQGSLSNANYRTHTTGALGVPFFAIKAGEVRYIGDLHFDVKSFPAKIARLTRDDAMAKKALAAYPGIQVAPHFRAPAYFPRGRLPAVVMSVSE